MLLVLFTVNCLNAAAQKVTYSEPDKKENASTAFEIIGKYGNNCLVYKNASHNHYISVYDKEMKLINNEILDFMPDRIINIDFISYPGFFLALYQFQKSNIVYCYAVKLGDTGKKISKPVLLDTTAINSFATNKIYTTAFSEDKKKILIYKRNIRNDQFLLASKIFDNDLNELEQFRQVFLFNKRKDNFTDLFIDNSGGFVFAKTTKKRTGENASTMELMIHKSKIDSLYHFELDLKEKSISTPMIKIDNLNGNYIINALFYADNNKNIEGLHTTLFDFKAFGIKNTAFNSLSLSNLNSTAKNNSSNYDNLSPRNIIVKKSGGFLMVAEDYFTESLYSDNQWNRNDSYFPNTSASEYYLYNPYYNSYRPLSSNYGQSTIRYYYNDLVIASLDSSLNMEWNNAIVKKQYDTENDNFLSYSYLNSGKEIHFLFIENNNQRALISNNSLFTNGEIKRYPAVKNEEKNYEFMPRLGKQTGINQIILPFLYFNKIGFAKLDF